MNKIHECIFNHAHISLSKWFIIVIKFYDGDFLKTEKKFHIWKQMR